MTNDLHIRDRVLYLLHEIKNKLSEKDVFSMERDIKAGEWGLAFEDMCSQLYEYDAIITQKIYDEFDAVGKLMNMDERAWVFLKELIKNKPEIPSD